VREHSGKGLAVVAICFMWLMAMISPLATPYALMDNAAQEDELPLGSNVSSSSDLFISLLKLIFVLILIIALIYLLVKFMARRNQNLFGKRPVKVLSGVQLAAGKSLQIVEIGGTVYVLGVGEDVRLIDKITDKETARAIMEQYQIQDSGVMPSVINNWLTRLRNRGNHEQDHLPGSSFQDLLRERLGHVEGQQQKIDELLSDYEHDVKERSKQ
jgi:Flagellar biogenesis protein